MFAAPYPYLFLLLPAAVLARDDFRTRRVGVVWLAVLGIIAAGTSWQQSGLQTMLLQTACNAILSAVLLGCLALWLRVRGWLGSTSKPALSSCRLPRYAPDTENALCRASEAAGSLRIPQTPGNAIPSVSVSVSQIRFTQQFGAGDAAFLLTVSPLFVPAAFVRFLIAACVLSLVWWWLHRSRRRTIPFAGMAGLTLGGWIMFKIICLWLS